MKGCLDPNIPFNIREKLLPMVTVTLQELIRTYPTVAFHTATQRLAVVVGFSSADGRSSQTGQVVLWDLRTATRVQVIQAHPSFNIAAIVFYKPPPGSDAMGLATYSWDENMVKVWQPHSGFFGSLASTLGISADKHAARPENSESILNSLASGGTMKLTKTFKIDPNMEKEVPWSQVLKHVALEWPSERSLILRRLPPNAPVNLSL